MTCQQESSRAEDLPVEKVDISHTMPAAETEETPQPTIEAASQSAPTEDTGDLLVIFLRIFRYSFYAVLQKCYLYHTSFHRV